MECRKVVRLNGSMVRLDQERVWYAVLEHYCGVGAMMSKSGREVWYAGVYGPDDDPDAEPENRFAGLTERDCYRWLVDGGWLRSHSDIDYLPSDYTRPNIMTATLTAQRCEIPGWINSIFMEVIEDYNRTVIQKYGRDHCFNVNSVNKLLYYNNRTSGTSAGSYGFKLEITLECCVTRERNIHYLVFNMVSGQVYLSNGYCRIGRTYPLNVSKEGRGDFAE